MSVICELSDIIKLNWITCTNYPSIYVSWVPDELTEELAKDFFETCIGKINRLEFALHKNGKNRILFVHFSSWIDTDQSVLIRYDIINQHPNPIILEIKLKNKNNYTKSYILKCHVNINPIKNIEYNTHQLYDMIQKQNDTIINLQNQLNEIKEQLMLIDKK
jgi:hypothetical protein